MTSNRKLFVAGLVIALLIAGVVSFYASSRPDGLEHVATSTGFDEGAEHHATEHGPMADYATDGVEDEHLSVGIAGVTGALVVLALTGGLVAVVRRRRRTSVKD